VIVSWAVGSADPTLIAVALAAAMVNGAIGYGFSTLVVPVALLFYPSQVLNPGLVLAEIALNLLSVFLNRKAIPRIFSRILPMLLGSLPGICFGIFFLKSASADGLRLGTFLVLLPLVLMQAAGLRRPLRRGSPVELPAGFAIGTLYACTTISGPPLGLLLNNQGLAQDDFRAAMSLFRVTQSVVTSLGYLALGVYSPPSVRLSLHILPCILIGIPLGRLLLRTIDAESFRRVCMAFDAVLISFGLSRLLALKGLLPGPAAYAPMGLVAALNLVLLYSYFSKRGRLGRGLAEQSAEAVGDQAR
jgi:uncharacterized membrane protein YfcA